MEEDVCKMRWRFRWELVIVCLFLKALILVGIVIVKEMDWHQVNDLVETARHQKLVQDIQSLASSGTLSDFKFIVEGRELEVHKAILAGEW